MMRVLWMRVRKALGDQRGQAGGRAWQLLTKREQRDGLGPSEHHAQTSHERPNQPSQAAESRSLMSFFILVALRSAWSARRRPYLGAKHELLLPKERRSREEDKGPCVGVVRTTGQPLSRRQSGGSDAFDHILPPWRVSVPPSWRSPWAARVATSQFVDCGLAGDLLLERSKFSRSELRN